MKLKDPFARFTLHTISNCSFLSMSQTPDLTFYGSLQSKLVLLWMLNNLRAPTFSLETLRVENRIFIISRRDWQTWMIMWLDQ